MALKKKPVTGMKDILPAEMEIRDYVIGLIKETYRSFGFSSIETPCVEHIENLCSKQGGDNEKLIFKILKRGEKLKLAEAKEEADLRGKKASLKKAEKELASLKAKKAKADAKSAEEAKKAEAEAVLKKLLASGMSADEILEKLK